MRLLIGFQDGFQLSGDRSLGMHVYFIMTSRLPYRRRFRGPLAGAGKGFAVLAVFTALMLPAASPAWSNQPVSSLSQAQVQAVAKAMKAIKRGRLAAAVKLSETTKDLTTRRLLTWLISTSGVGGIPPELPGELRENASHWPRQRTLRKAYEIALVGKRLPADQLIAQFRDAPPISLLANLALVRAHLARHDKTRAAAILRKLWRTVTFSTHEQGKIRREFASLLRAGDHKARIDMLLYADRTVAALALARRTNPAFLALTRARVAVIKGQRNAGRLLAAVPASLRGRAGYQFDRIRYLRRKKQYHAAIAAMLRAPTDDATLVDGDAWWVERRILSREALELGEARMAYTLVSKHNARSRVARVDAAFHAGWYALRFLNKPAVAARHFGEIVKIATKARSRARGLYWLARAREAAGAEQEAASLYAKAAQYDTVYYGQLARARLGIKTPALAPSAPADEKKFLSTEMGRATQLLVRAGHRDKAKIFLMHFGAASQKANLVAGAARYATRAGLAHTAHMLAKRAAARGHNVADYAFPEPAMISRNGHFSNDELALIYAIARQESAFNPRAKSPAGARGLMQLMPATARRAARRARLPYSSSRLSDPVYNARLATTHLRHLKDVYDGSYIKVFVAYNAGGGRLSEWIERFGDPSDAAIDAIDWVERIPFLETRNYVQHVMENVQVYGARIDDRPLTIATHLSVPVR